MCNRNKVANILTGKSQGKAWKNRNSIVRLVSKMGTSVCVTYKLSRTA